MTPADLPALVAEMRRLGIVHLKLDGCELLLGPDPMPPSAAVTALRGALGKTAAQHGLESWAVREARDESALGRELTDDEILFASSRGWPDEEARKVKAQ